MNFISYCPIAPWGGDTLHLPGHGNKTEGNVLEITDSMFPFISVYNVSTINFVN